MDTIRLDSLKAWLSDAGKSTEGRKTLIVAIFVPLFIILATRMRGGRSNASASDKSNPPPPQIPEWVPYLSNGFRYMTDPKTFFEHAAKTLRRSKLATFSIGPVAMTLVTGSAQVQPLFRSPDFSPDKFLMLIFENLHGMTSADLALFKADKSGRHKIPAPGFEDWDEDKRLWFTQAGMVHEHLGKVSSSAVLARNYDRFFDEELVNQQPLGEWREVKLMAFMKRAMATAATASLAGTDLLRERPDFVSKFWEFDDVALQLIWGLPWWLNPRPLRIRSELNTMVRTYLDESFARVDAGEKGTEGHRPGADPDWEPVFGSRYSRTMAHYLRDKGISPQGQAGNFIINIFGVNSNSVPVTIWALFELIRDPELYALVQEEVGTAVVESADDTEDVDDEKAGGGGANTQRRGKHFDTEKLLSLPFLQAVYTEALRLHVAINITRQAVKDTSIAGYRISSGALLQAPTHLGGLDDQVWGREGHPAGEFWPWRHVRRVTAGAASDADLNDDKKNATTGGREKWEFVQSAKASEFFPYGGGVTLCPGRHFAKREIMLTVASVLSRFDVEFVRWEMVGEEGEEGKASSDRPARDNEKFFGAAAVPPDREMRVKWRRRW